MISNTKQQKVAVGLSGGVDSSIAAYLLKEQGYDVVGVHMQCWDYNDAACTGEQDRADAVKIATQLNIPFLTLNFEKEYRENVISYFYNEYRSGRTPNPDVVCNREIKFGLFYDWAMSQGFDFIATGHYARVKHSPAQLFKGVDSSKDQSYFLYQVPLQKLEKVLFPLGEMYKEDVRKLATNIGLPTANKADSVGICFIGEVNIKDFLRAEIPFNFGPVTNISGEVIGEHDGIAFYTIGQRHGFRVSKYHGLPLYVIGKDASTNTLVVGYSEQGKCTNFSVQSTVWHSNVVLPLECSVRIRHLGEVYSCTLSGTPSNVNVELHKGIHGIAPGQSAVFYLDNLVMGGGIIH
ncbi:tRNA 2-thiouridine(34) synthase MnmA [candidate division WWE3 bacterium]|uniref:tRNA-specific 2-thiouridylase MnmA n=1 Tax=candidate division WWE3 bacterium TaxID=2053526 RepID=A0A955EBN2_UNCKA|nr:tRNA 2-thiouridine(34) synthase MnmA [candidate division WWE3 bacterium]